MPVPGLALHAQRPERYRERGHGLLCPAGAACCGPQLRHLPAIEAELAWPAWSKKKVASQQVR
jgi:hypothetical protein